MHTVLIRKIKYTNTEIVLIGTIKYTYKLLIGTIKYTNNVIWGNGAHMYYKQTKAHEVHFTASLKL